MTLPTASTTAIVTTLIAAAAAIAKKLLPRPKPKPEYITRIEFHAGLDRVRDRIAASYLAMADKLDVHHKESLAGIDRLATATEARLDSLESNLARVDERTRL